MRHRKILSVSPGQKQGIQQGGGAWPCCLLLSQNQKPALELPSCYRAKYLVRSDLIIHTYVVTSEIIFAPKNKIESIAVFSACFPIFQESLTLRRDPPPPFRVAVSSINIVGIWQARPLLSCQLLNAERIGTWQAGLFPIPCELTVREVNMLLW